MIARLRNRKTYLQLCFTSIILLSVIASTFAQVPVTDLYLFQLTQDNSGKWQAHSPKFLSGFNEGGYTNQPEFITDDELYVSVQTAEMQQNDIFSLNILTGQFEPVTATEASEFSPSKAPHSDAFSCVRQVIGEGVDQQLFTYPLDRSRNGKSEFREIKNIGYYCWLDEKLAGMFLVDEPSHLALADTETGEHKIIASNIGRSLRRTTEGKLAYVHKYSDEFWYLKTLDPNTLETEILTKTLQNSEDFVISQGGHYFMGKESVLYVFDPSQSEDWIPVADLGIFGVQKITRLAINSRMELAVVSLHE